MTTKEAGQPSLPRETGLQTGSRGLSSADARERLQEYGRNQLPEPPLPGLHVIFLRQFLSPFIYILLVAAVVSWALNQMANAVFIMAVLLLNAVIGTVQEFSAQRSHSVIHLPDGGSDRHRHPAAGGADVVAGRLWHRGHDPDGDWPGGVSNSRGLAGGADCGAGHRHAAHGGPQGDHPQAGGG